MRQPYPHSPAGELARGFVFGLLFAVFAWLAIIAILVALLV